jgi:NUMOD4 motif/HNH endonuclease
MNNEVEVWKDIPNYEGLYQVSNFGNVKSLDRIVLHRTFNAMFKSKNLKKNISTDGYYNVGLSKSGIVKTIKIHKLVAITFLNHNPNRFKTLVIDHINFDKLDNRLINLRLITNRQNTSFVKRKSVKTSKYIGVSLEEGRFRARIYYNGKNLSLGRFKTEIEAHEAYQKALKIIENEQA